jgi:hypothetical protein
VLVRRAEHSHSRAQMYSITIQTQCMYCTFESLARSEQESQPEPVPVPVPAEAEGQLVEEAVELLRLRLLVQVSPRC